MENDERTVNGQDGGRSQQEPTFRQGRDVKIGVESRPLFGLRGRWGAGRDEWNVFVLLGGTIRSVAGRLAERLRVRPVRKWRQRRVPVATTRLRLGARKREPDQEHGQCSQQAGERNSGKIAQSSLDRTEFQSVITSIWTGVNGFPDQPTDFTFCVGSAGGPV